MLLQPLKVQELLQEGLLLILRLLLLLLLLLGPQVVPESGLPVPIQKPLLPLVLLLLLLDEVVVRAGCFVEQRGHGGGGGCGIDPPHPHGERSKGQGRRVREGAAQVRLLLLLLKELQLLELLQLRREGVGLRRGPIDLSRQLRAAVLDWRDRTAQHPRGAQ
jgi:hypothetical protein